jgi:drug/metabolite transporter (DMT)-like permease
VGNSPQGFPMAPLRVAALTVCSLVCFAANSLLCRAALGRGLVDPATFTFVRIGSGAAALWVGTLALRRSPPSGGNLASALTLFLYAAAFSLAYVRIEAGVGALLLFGAVQLTMVGWTALRGTRPRPLQVAGILAASAGLGWLALPGATAPDPLGAALMLVAGAAWGVYTLRGRPGRDPLAATAHDFLLAAPLAAVFGAAFARGSWSAAGLGLAAASGVLASGGGYTLWFAVVPALGPIRAAAVQLGVPVLAGLGATALLGEQLTPRIAAAGVAILLGIGLTLRR